MKKTKTEFDEDIVLERLKHYLPAQAPLKDFVHHNTLHAFQHHMFHDGLREAAVYFGYKVYLPLAAYRKKYAFNEISIEALEFALRKKGENRNKWEDKVLYGEYRESIHPRIGRLHDKWKEIYRINLVKYVHPKLFRLISNYLDQGIAIREFPIHESGFLASIKVLEKGGMNSLFKSKRVRGLLFDDELSLKKLLGILLGDEALYAQYLFDQQFNHPGWSGLVSVLESKPGQLLDDRPVSIRDFIILELLFEIDILDTRFHGEWEPLCKKMKNVPGKFLAPVEKKELFEVLEIWQEAYEWSYYQQVLNGIAKNATSDAENKSYGFYALFCIDDRECSIRRHLEMVQPACETFGTPGFFNVEFFFQPQHSNFHTKLCPAPMTPQYLIKEESEISKPESDAHFTKRSHSLVIGWLFTQTLGFWSALKLFVNIFRPAISPATSYSFRHMDKKGNLSIEFENETIDGLQVGFKLNEMVDRVEGLLRSIGLLKFDASIVYLVGHGASSVNNTHYAGYDCGACCGRPGAVNARVMSYMANKKEVRELLKSRGIVIPERVQFIGAMHDTTRDEIEFYDEDILSEQNQLQHKTYVLNFKDALRKNAKERARRFELTESKLPLEKVHELVKRRSVSLFEPRPELNHATNCLCIVGPREMTKGLFLDRRAFLNSYNASLDPNGNYLLNILKAAAPVCGGINLEYYFSRVDTYRLGAGSKLPHNVMGLIGVANGLDGDLRPGLPFQMVEVHDPLRLLMVVVHKPEVIKSALARHEPTYEWFLNEWIHLVAIHPETKEFYHFKNHDFEPLILPDLPLEFKANLDSLMEHNADNLPVFSVKAQYA